MYILCITYDIYNFKCILCLSIQILLEASTEAVDEMIAKTSDTGTLITYISVMKRYLNIVYSFSVRLLDIYVAHL